jgi:hypothetical protein
MQNIVSETVLAGPADLNGHVSCLPSLGRALLGDQSMYINVFRPDADGGGRGWIALAPDGETGLAGCLLRILLMLRGKW